MTKSSFITVLVDETLRLHSEQVLDNDLEIKLNDFKIEFIRGEFIPQSCLLRFQTKIGLIDIPTNWSCFKLEHGQRHTLIQNHNDEDKLLNIFKKCWNESFSSLLVTESNGHCYIIGLTPDDEYYLTELTNAQEFLIKSA